jgi:hypothetical protein
MVLCVEGWIKHDNIGVLKVKPVKKERGVGMLVESLADIYFVLPSQRRVYHSPKMEISKKDALNRGMLFLIYQ